MSRFDKMLKELNTMDIQQTTEYWLDSIPYNIRKKYFNNEIKVMKTGVCKRSNPLYTTSIEVIDMNGRYLGVHHISNKHHLSMSYKKFNESLDFFETKI